jgi:alpha-1,3-rhamnosyl/mannosyltransferase
MAGEALVSGYVAERWVRELMTRATVLLMPSFYEGFSLPIVEAMAVGCPVICSDIEVHREVAGHAAERVAPLETQGWANAINRAVEDESWRKSRQSAGIERAKRFSWQQAANMHAQLISDIVIGAG